MTATVEVSLGAATSAGNVRTLNEDNYLACERLFVVADGMGGHAAGEVASRLAVEAFARLADRAAAITRDDVTAAVRDANDRIVWAAEQDATRSGMGTTLAGLALVGGGGDEHWLVFNVGDSRVYRWDGTLRQLTVDHSEVEELVAAGSLTREQARTHRRRNVVTRSLGSPTTPQVDQWLLPPRAGDRYLVCSDGLTVELGDDTIAQIVGAGADAQSAADWLVAAAVSAGGRDNVTVVIVDVTSVVESADEAEDTRPREAVTR